MLAALPPSLASELSALAKMSVLSIGPGRSEPAMRTQTKTCVETIPATFKFQEQKLSFNEFGENSHRSERRGQSKSCCCLAAQHPSSNSTQTAQQNSSGMLQVSALTPDFALLSLLALLLFLLLLAFSSWRSFCRCSSFSFFSRSARSCDSFASPVSERAPEHSAQVGGGGDLEA